MAFEIINLLTYYFDILNRLVVDHECDRHTVRQTYGHILIEMPRSCRTTLHGQKKQTCPLSPQIVSLPSVGFAD